MPICVRCNCGTRFRGKDEDAGKRTRCPDCGEVLVIPPQVSSAQEREPPRTVTVEKQGQPAPPPATTAVARHCPSCNKPCPQYRTTCRHCGFPIGKNVDPATIDSAVVLAFQKRREEEKATDQPTEQPHQESGSGREVLIGLALWAAGLVLVMLGLWLAVSGINEGSGFVGVALCGGTFGLAVPLFKIGFDCIRGMVKGRSKTLARGGANPHHRG